MYYRLTLRKTKIQTKWFRVQRIQYWRICEKYSGDYIIEGREETRSKKQIEQWINYRTLGQIARAKANIIDIRNSEFISNMLKDRLYDAELQLDEAETQVRKAINSPRKK